MLAMKDGRVEEMRTITIPCYTASDNQIENIRRSSLLKNGIDYEDAFKNLSEETLNPRNYKDGSVCVPELEIIQ